MLMVMERDEQDTHGFLSYCWLSWHGYSIYIYIKLSFSGYSPIVFEEGSAEEEKYDYRI